MNKSKKTKIIIWAVILCLFTGMACAGFVGYKFYKHEKSQQATISELNSRVSKLSAEMKILKNTVEGKSIQWGESGTNYLAIGNSITLHGLATYWWDDDRGMAASADEKDYVHLVGQYLEQSSDSVTIHSINLSSWEVNGSDRAEFLELLNPYLSPSINVITIQLGENASNLDTWESDYEELINYVKQGAPNAKIYVIGDFWSNGNRDAEKEQAAIVCGVTYVSLDGIKDNKEYYSSIGTEVEDSDGKLHAIDHQGVASHPGDKGMEAIANRVIEKMK